MTSEALKELKEVSAVHFLFSQSFMCSFHCLHSALIQSHCHFKYLNWSFCMRIMVSFILLPHLNKPHKNTLHSVLTLMRFSRTCSCRNEKKTTKRLTFLAINVIKKVDAVFDNTVTHIAEVTAHTNARTKMHHLLF